MKPPGSVLNKTDLEKLKHSWITPELAHQAKLRRVVSCDGAQLVGRSNKGGNYAGIIFPYVWPGSDTIREYRLRRDKPELEPRPEGGFKEKNKYLSPPGRGSMFYFMPGTPADWLHNATLPIVFTEGEKKVIALHRLALHEVEPQHPRFLAIGIPGVWNFLGSIGKAEGPDGDRHDIRGVIADFGRVELGNRDVFILYDSNVHEKPEVKAARSRVAQEFKSKRARVFYVELPRVEGLNGVDDYLAAQGPEFVLTLIKNARLADVKVPEGFRVSNSGVYAIDLTGEKDDTWICSWLAVRASTRNHQNREWGQLLHFKDKDGTEHKWLMPMAMLSGDGGEYRERLLSMGLRIAPGRKPRELLTNYIQTANPESRVRCVSKVGWHGNVFVLPDESFGDDASEPVLFQSTLDSDHNLRVAGTLADWRENVARYCVGNPSLIFAVSLALAGPLLPLAGESGGGFHFRGASSTGKTTALLVGGSVWGGGGRNGYVQTWRTTTNGLEAMAELHNHGLLCLDEISQCDPRETGEIAYTLANGSGKLRMTRSIGARKRLEWEILFLSSGESSLGDHVALTGRKAHGGQEVRLCDIEADRGAGMGMFENIHSFTTSAAFANHMAERSRKYYGSAIRAFLTRLVQTRAKGESYYREMRDYFIRKYVPAGASGEVYRVACRFALAATAGELARDVTGWVKGTSENAAAVLFKSWLRARGTSGGSDLEAAIRQVRGFIEMYGSSRFYELSTYGTYGRSNGHVRDRAGFKEENEDGDTEYYILREVFRKEVCSGFDYKIIAAALDNRGYLVKENDSFTMRKRLPELGRAWVYAVKSTILEEA